jgi:phage N-6-adenine-methyltransferase
MINTGHRNQLKIRREKMNTENKSNTPTEIRDLWQTPKFFFDYYDKRFNFKWDLACNTGNRLCEFGSTKEFSAFDTLSTQFLETPVWCNPPYSNIMPWVEKCIDISVRSETKVVMLIPADTSVKWFKLAFNSCTECHFISGRLAFINAETQKPVSGNNKGSAVFIFDPSSPVKKSVHLIDRESMK